MAILKNIKKTNNIYTLKNGLSYCDAEYNEYDYNNEKFVRIQTFGSNNRQDKGKQSQVIHINKQIAEQLINLLRESFNVK